MCEHTNLDKASEQSFSKWANLFIVMGQWSCLRFRVYQIEVKTVAEGQCYQCPVIHWQMKEHICIHAKKIETGILISQPGLELAV